MRRLLTAPLRWLLRRLPPSLVLRTVRAFFTRYVWRLPPEEALRLLFAVDAELYRLEGKLAIAYDGGVHTKHRHLRYHDFFTERVESGQRVLDIGCGNGAVAYDLARKGAIVVGVDLNPDNIALARQRHAHPNVTYVHGDALRDLPTNQPFDVVILSNVLEHIEARVDFLRRVLAEIRPQGVLIRVPSFERDWRVPLQRELGLDYRLDPTHFIEYTLDEFRGEMAGAGLEVALIEMHWGEIWADLQPQQEAA